MLNIFSHCTGFTSMTIPKGITSIGNSAFSGCNNLYSVTIHSETIGSWFSGLSSLKDVIIGEEVTSIDNNAFSYCRNLVSIMIPNNVSSIGSNAFYGCNNLLSLIIGTGVTAIGQYAFEDTNLMKTIWLTNTPPTGYTYANGAVNYVANDQYSSLNNKIVYPFISSLFEVDGIYYVPVSPSERTCDAIDCKYDETMANTNIYSTVSYKGISMSIQKIQPYLCYNNMYIENLTCDNKGDIADFAFSNCTNISSVVCNNNGNIGENAFKGCTSIKSIACNNSGIIGNNAFESCSNVESLSLGDNIISIGNKAFKDCSLLQAVTIPNTVTLLDDYAFSGCSSLERIIIGNHVNTIGQGTFENCKLIQSINIPDSVKTINNYAFSGCTGLKTLVIADREGELSLGKNGSSPLFADCPLDSVYIGGNITYNTSSGAGYSPFYRNTSLRTVVITDKETEISENEFYGCSNLKNVSIGNGVTTIGNWAFSGCSSLDYFAFGSNMKTIGKEAFSDCTAMTNLCSSATLPPVCGLQALDDINKWNCKLHIPKGTISAYQQADQWKDFFFINDDVLGIGTTKTASSAPSVIYDLNGYKKEELQPGINIIKYSDGTVKKVMQK